MILLRYKQQTFFQCNNWEGSCIILVLYINYYSIVWGKFHCVMFFSWFIIFKQVINRSFNIFFIGSGVFTEKEFFQGDFLLEYVGKLLSIKEGLATEKKYKKDPTVGSFMYFFDCRGKKYWWVLLQYLKQVAYVMFRRSWRSGFSLEHFRALIYKLLHWKKIYKVYRPYLPIDKLFRYCRDSDPISTHIMIREFTKCRTATRSVCSGSRCNLYYVVSDSVTKHSTSRDQWLLGNIAARTSHAESVASGGRILNRPLIYIMSQRVIASKIKMKHLVT